MAETTEDFQLPLQWRKLLAVLAAIALVVFILRQVGPILSSLIIALGPLLLALILAYIFNPIVSFVQRKLRLGRVMGILTLAALVVAVLVGLLFWIIPTLYRQLAFGLVQLTEWAALMLERYGHHLNPNIQQNLQGLLERGELGNLNMLMGEVFGRIEDNGVPTGAMAAVAGGVANWMRRLFTIGAALGLMTVLAFFLLIDFHKVPSVIVKLLPEDRRDQIWDILLKIDVSVGGFLRGQLMVALIVGLLISILLFAIGMGQYALLIGFTAGLLNLIPYLGPVMGFLPAALFVLFSSQYGDWNERGIYFIILSIGFISIQSFESFVLQPFVVGTAAQLHPLTVITALMIGAQAGLGGMIIAVPVAAAVKVVWVESFWKHRKADPEQREEYSLLRRLRSRGTKKR